MVIARSFVASLLGIASSFAHYHEPEISINFDPEKRDQSHIHLNHQSSFVSDFDHVLILSGSFKPKLDKSHYSEFGIGYRKFFDSVGFGMNAFGSMSNKPNFYIYQLSPGIELFAGHFQLSLNHYIPYKQSMVVKKNEFKFHNISELNLTFKPSRKYEFSVGSYFNHSSKKMGYKGSVSAFIADQWQIKASPYYESKNKGVVFSLGFSFGGAKERRTQSIRKSESFFYTGANIPRKQEFVAPVVFLPEPVQPVIMPPISVDLPPSSPVPVNDGWWDFFFGRFYKSR